MHDLFNVLQISVADFLMYEAVYCWGELEPELISTHENVKKYLERFEVRKQEFPAIFHAACVLVRFPDAYMSLFNVAGYPSNQQLHEI